MSIAPITPVAPVSPMTALRATEAAGAGTGTGDSFGAALAGRLEELQQLHTTSNELAVKAATGELTDVHDYMIAAGKASSATSLVVAVRNKAIESFNEIMRMPV